MKKSWTNGLNGSDKAEMEDTFRAAGAFRERLTELLRRDIEARNRKQRGEALYDSPGWQYQQADANGFTRALEHVISLID